jgi:hypothetical protein
MEPSDIEKDWYSTESESISDETRGEDSFIITFGKCPFVR